MSEAVEEAVAEAIEKCDIGKLDRLKLSRALTRRVAVDWLIYFAEEGGGCGMVYNWFFDNFSLDSEESRAVVSGVTYQTPTSFVALLARRVPLNKEEHEDLLRALLENMDYTVGSSLQSGELSREDIPDDLKLLRGVASRWPTAPAESKQYKSPVTTEEMMELNNDLRGIAWFFAIFAKKYGWEALSSIVREAENPTPENVKFLVDEYGRSRR